MKHELYINGFKVDLADDIPFPLTFSIADIKEPENRKRSVSKTVVLQGTEKNKQIFSGAYELSLSDESGLGLGFAVDPTIRVEARYIKNNREIFNGLCQLLQVNIENGGYTFEVVLFSDFINFFQEWGDIRVSELDWSEYDHTLNKTNIENSWDTSVIQNGVATSNFTGTDPDGFGYLYPIIDYGYNSSLYTFNINDLVPYVYCKEVLDKAFSLVGKTISSDFTDSNMFKALIFGFGGGKKNMLPPTDASSRRVNYSFDGADTRVFNPAPFGSPNAYQVVTGYTESLDSFTETQINDTYAQYNNTTGTINIQRSGRYRLNLDFTIDISGIWSAGTVGGNNSTIEFQVYKNGNIVHRTNLLNLPTSVTSYDVDIDKELTLKSGDFIDIKYQVTANTYVTVATSGIPTYTVAVDFDNDFAFDLTSIEGIYQEGDTINLSRFIPDMKVSDFVKGMITMFNLYIDDTLENETVKIEPLADFYLDSDDTEDWDLKLDYSKKQEILPASNISGKTYAFQFLEDNDTYHEIYFSEFEERYGNYTYDVSNGYQKGVKEFKVPFAQTIPVEVSAGYVIPRIVDIDLQTNLVQPYKGKPRIFFYNGLQTANFNIIYSAGTTSYTDYPQVHHSYGDITDLTFDLNFGVPRKVFYTFSKYPLDNIFNDYHRQFIRELSARDSKIYRAYFKLDDLDIYKGMFRKLVNIKGVLFRKNIITDYDATGYMTTKVELLKVLETNDPYTTPPLIVTDTGLADQRDYQTAGGIGIVAQGADLIRGGINDDLATRNILTSYGSRI